MAENAVPQLKASVVIITMMKVKMILELVCKTKTGSQIRNAALRRARRGFQQAEIRSDYGMMCHYENIVDALTAL